MDFAAEFLPVQHEYNRLYTGGAPGDRAIYDAVCSASSIRPPAEEFIFDAPDGMPIENMASNPISLRFLAMLIGVSRACHILEIGTFIGLSAMTFARAMPAWGHVDTIEKGKDFADLARINVIRNGLHDRINVINADAVDYLLTHEYPKGIFDFVFIDGDKERYLDIFHLVGPLVCSGGMIVIDDVFFHGDALNDLAVTSKGRGCQQILRAATMLGCQKLVLPLANGILILVKP